MTEPKKIRLRLRPRPLDAVREYSDTPKVTPAQEDVKPKPVDAPKRDSA